MVQLVQSKLARVLIKTSLWKDLVKMSTIKNKKFVVDAVDF